MNEFCDIMVALFAQAWLPLSWVMILFRLFSGSGTGTRTSTNSVTIPSSASPLDDFDSFFTYFFSYLCLFRTSCGRPSNMQLYELLYCLECVPDAPLGFLSCAGDFYMENPLILVEKETEKNEVNT